MDFMQLISEKECSLERYAKEQSTQKRPLIIYGAGYGARILIPYFQRYGIDDFKLCVDDGYYRPGVTVMGYPVYSLEEQLTQAVEPYDLVVAIYEMDMSRLDYLSNRFKQSLHRIIYDDFFPHLYMPPMVYCIDRAFYEANNAFLTAFYEKCEDEKSKKALISFVEQRISGKYCYANGIVNDAAVQYYDPEIVVRNSEKGVLLIDGGAYDGMDTKRFFDFYGDDGFSFVVEPDPTNAARIHETLHGTKDRYRIVNRILSDENTVTAFASGGGMGSSVSESGDITVESILIDDILNNYPDEFCNRDVLIKLDIEGMELKALKGAKNLISKCLPTLAVSLYHNPEDIVMIPGYLMENYPQYRLYVRRYNTGFRDTVLYAVPDKKFAISNMIGEIGLTCL